VSKALSIDAEVPFRNHFPLLGSDIDSSFYDIEEDEVYFFKGDYVYSYKNTNKSDQPLDMQINGGLLKETFRGIPSRMNAAFLYKPNSTN
jgi:hypothetical protein